MLVPKGSAVAGWGRDRAIDALASLLKCGLGLSLARCRQNPRWTTNAGDAILLLAVSARVSQAASGQVRGAARFFLGLLALAPTLGS